MKTTNNTQMMKSIYLSRTLDTESRKCGYPNFPDDILSIIFDYTGRFDGVPKDIYMIRFDYSIVERNEYLRLMNKYPNNPDKIKNRHSSSKYRRNGVIYFCSRCQRFLKNNPKNHHNTRTHKNNQKSPLSNRQIFFGSFEKFKERPFWNGRIPINPRNYEIYDIGLFRC